MTRKRSDDNEIVNINDMKEKIRILDLTKEYLNKRRELNSEVDNVDTKEERAMCKECKKIKIVKETKIGRLCKECNQIDIPDDKLLRNEIRIINGKPIKTKVFRHKIIKYYDNERKLWIPYDLI